MVWYDGVHNIARQAVPSGIRFEGQGLALFIGADYFAQAAAKGTYPHAARVIARDGNDFIASYAGGVVLVVFPVLESLDLWV